MIRNNRLLLLVICFISFMLMATACNAGAEQESSRVIRLGLSTFPGYAPIYVAQDKDLCAQHDLRLEIIQADDNSLQLAQLQAGEIDAYIDTNNRLVFAKASGVDQVAFLAVDYSFGADGIVTTDDVQDIKDIVEGNLEVGADITDTAYFMLMALADEEGLGPDDFNLVQMESGAATAAFIAKDVDVAGTYEPWLTQALDRPGSHLLVTTQDRPGIISDLFITKREIAESRRDELVALGRCWYDALDYVEANEQESIEIMARAYEIPTDEMAEIMDSIAWPDYEEGLSYLRDGELHQLLDLSDRLYQKIGILEEPAGDVQSMIYSEIAEGIDTP